MVRASENIKIVRSKGNRDLVPVSQSKWWVSESSLGDLRSKQVTLASGAAREVRHLLLVWGDI